MYLMGYVAFPLACVKYTPNSVCPNKTELKNPFFSQALVAHAYNSRYSGVGDQEDKGSKPVQANSSQDPISKNLSQR
jgi:hypothetical protein